MPCPAMEFWPQIATRDAVVDRCTSSLVSSGGFVGEANDVEQEAVGMADMMVPTARTIEIPSRVQRFLQIREMHDDSDLQVICRKFSSTEPGERVTFYVHREVLMQKCAFFADCQNFTVFSGIASHRSFRDAQLSVAFEEITEYDDDIVYEVLRFVYTGMLCPPYGFSRRAAQFLKLIDYLGVFEMAERHPELPNIVRDPVITNMLRSMFVQGSDSADRIRALVQEFCRGSLLGFQLNRGLVLRIVELNPSFVTPELQQELMSSGLLDSKNLHSLATETSCVAAENLSEATESSSESETSEVSKEDVAMVDVDIIPRPAKRLCVTEQRYRTLQQQVDVHHDMDSAHFCGSFPLMQVALRIVTSAEDIPRPLHVATPTRAQNQPRVVACAGC
eukprot:gnl/MRDRNA2_/MRDRNA2_104404_c0_seq1.p1 gnl/MRDRNA2_/MRDRNA2_104404_c0~~gnl/MRDRNA2_/MRDRNA2_104404_c0_seq1.p1  ORF type:complete len:422 (-),score=56.78 gnl/MRDRNA2_/MRDRNA2_104404_c0_seq1:137-1309(-)